MPSPLNLVGRQVLVTTSDGDYIGKLIAQDEISVILDSEEIPSNQVFTIRNIDPHKLRTVTIQTISRTLRGRILSHGPNSIRLQVPEHTITISRDQIVHITR